MDNLSRDIELIRKGWAPSGPELAIEWNLTKERVRQILHEEGVHSIWKDNRTNHKSAVSQKASLTKDRVLTRSRLRSQIGNAGLINHMGEQGKGWQCRMAIKYMASLRYNNIPFPKVFAFLDAYKTAHDCYLAKTDEELIAIAGVGKRFANRLRKQLNLPGLIGRSLSDVKRYAIEVAHEFPFLSQKDVGYFVGVNNMTVGRIFRSIGYRNCWEYLVLNSYVGGFVTCREASQVYEFMDLQDSPEEVADLLGISRPALNLAMNNRHEGERLENRLIDALSQMFPKMGVNDPYVPPIMPTLPGV
jgi:hypothetical protein